MTEGAQRVEEVTLCNRQGLEAVNGTCPRHGGDACLEQYVPMARLQAAEAAVSKVAKVEAEGRAITDAGAQRVDEQWRVVVGEPGSGPWDRVTIEYGEPHTAFVVATVNRLHPRGIELAHQLVQLVARLRAVEGERDAMLVHHRAAAEFLEEHERVKAEARRLREWVESVAAYFHEAMDHQASHWRSCGSTTCSDAAALTPPRPAGDRGA